ncbi:MAG: hypothetical protein RLZZ546_2506, partial [Bacteroidota bacterium]
MSKSDIINVLKSCLDILRDNEALTGEKALRNLSYLLILKLIEPRIGNEIDFNICEQFTDFDENIDLKSFNILLNATKFSELAKVKKGYMFSIFKGVWDIFLSTHPKTKIIFPRVNDKFIDIKNLTTLEKLVDKINNIDLSKCEYDVLGNSYEEVIKDVMTGKTLGQYFTQPLIKNIMVDLINPKVYSDGKIESCGDPSMGTGGFLISYISEIQKKAKEQNIQLDWEYIIQNGIYGREIEADTYQLGLSNMLISTGHLFNNIELSDSIRKPINYKVDIVMANPPFGISGLNYDDFHYDEKDKVLPIKTKNAVSLFLQVIISMLKINGRCAVVLPNGQELFSDNKEHVLIREYLVKTCNLKKIINLPSGVFTYTNIKTCIMYFEKIKEMEEVLKVTEKGKTRKYEFIEEHETSEVEFYNYNEKLELIKKIDIETLKSKNYILNLDNYKEKEKVNYSSNVEIKKLGEVCEIDKGKRIVKSKCEEGKYPVIGGGDFTFYCNQYNREGKTCKISSDGISSH